MPRVAAPACLASAAAGVRGRAAGPEVVEAVVGAVKAVAAVTGALTASPESAQATVPRPAPRDPPRTSRAAEHRLRAEPAVAVEAVNRLGVPVVVLVPSLRWWWESGKGDVKAPLRLRLA